MPTKTKRIIGWTLTVLVGLFLIGASGVPKFLDFPGKADKLTRLHTVSPMFSHGRVWGVESAKRPGEFRDWAEPLIEQVCSYVGEGSLEHDDLLDSATQALKYAADRFMGAFTKPPPTKAQLLQEAIDARPRPMVNSYYG